jgi:hypothetical protein
MSAVVWVAIGGVGLFIGAAMFCVLSDALRKDRVARIWVPVPFDPGSVIEGMIETARRTGQADYADFERSMTIRLAPEVNDQWVAIYQGRSSFHPSVIEAGMHLYRVAVRNTPTTPRRAA